MDEVESGMEWSRVEIATVTGFRESVNRMLLGVNHSVCECNSEGVA